MTSPLNTQGWNRSAKVICAFSVICMLIGIGTAIHRMSYLRDAVLAEATVSKVLQSETNTGKLKYSTIYVFSDQNGKEVRIVTAKADRPPVAKPGDTIEILYSPENPKQSMENQFHTKWGVSIIAGSLGFLYYMIFAIVAHFTSKRLEREAPVKSLPATS